MSVHGFKTVINEALKPAASPLDSSCRILNAALQWSSTWHRFIGDRALLQKGRTIVLNEGSEMAPLTLRLCEVRLTISVAMYSAYRCFVVTILGRSSACWFFFHQVLRNFDRFQGASCASMTRSAFRGALRYHSRRFNTVTSHQKEDNKQIPRHVAKHFLMMRRVIDAQLSIPMLLLTRCHAVTMTADAELSSVVVSCGCCVAAPGSPVQT